MQDVHMYICIYSVNMYITCTKHRTCFRFNQQNHHVFHKTIAICDFFFNENTILMFSIRHCIELCLVLKSRNKYVLNHIKNMCFFADFFLFNIGIRQSSLFVQIRDALPNVYFVRYAATVSCESL